MICGICQGIIQGYGYPEYIIQWLASTMKFGASFDIKLYWLVAWLVFQVKPSPKFYEISVGRNKQG